MNNSINSEIHEVCVAEFEDFMRRERLWETARREKNLQRYRKDLHALRDGFLSGLTLMAGSLFLLWLLLH
jgi:uncharacterized iron-regulated membrane protein